MNGAVVSCCYSVSNVIGPAISERTQRREYEHLLPTGSNTSRRHRFVSIVLHPLRWQTKTVLIVCKLFFFYRLDRPRYYNSVHLSLSSFIGCTATVTSLSLEHFRSITWNLFLSIGQHFMRWITIIKIHMMSEQLELISGQFFWWPERTVIFQSLEDVYLKVLSCWFQSEGTFIARGPTGHIIT